MIEFAVLSIHQQGSYAPGARQKPVMTRIGAPLCCFWVLVMFYLARGARGPSRGFRARVRASHPNGHEARVHAVCRVQSVTRPPLILRLCDTGPQGLCREIVRREMSPARIHQYVPIFYLKGWRSARDSKLARYSRIRGEIRVDRCSARATGFEPDLYQLTHVAEGERDAIERWLAQEVDTPASEALRVQLRGGQLMPDQHVAWVRFVMSMRARSPDAITMIRQTGDRNVREAQLRASLRN